MRKGKTLTMKQISRFSLIKEFTIFLWQNKLWWMIPIVLIFILLSLFIVCTQNSVVIPFIYTIF